MTPIFFYEICARRNPITLVETVKAHNFFSVSATSYRIPYQLEKSLPFKTATPENLEQVLKNVILRQGFFRKKNYTKN